MNLKVPSASGGPRLREVPSDAGAFYEWACEERWSDGLPLVPPTPERVAAMLQGTDRGPDVSVATIPPSYAIATTEDIAANAAMAGCRPEYLPVVVAAIETAAKPEVNLYGAQVTTHPCAVMVMVNGPLAVEIGMHSGSGLFGPGFRANATIGRAVRLVLQNIGGAHPGEVDRSSHGSAAKFSFAFAENEAASPWSPYHVDLGFKREDSTVTVVAAEAPQNLNDHVSSEPGGIMLTFAQSIASMATNNAYCRNSDYFVGFGIEHAAMLGREGWEKRDVQEYLFARARIPFEEWSAGGMFRMFPQPAYIDAAGPGMGVPMSDSPEDCRVIVVGGEGRHSVWMPTIGVGRSATGLVAHADGSPVRVTDQSVRDNE